MMNKLEKVDAASPFQVTSCHESRAPERSFDRAAAATVTGMSIRSGFNSSLTRPARRITQAQARFQVYLT